MFDKKKKQAKSSDKSKPHAKPDKSNDSQEINKQLQEKATAQREKRKQQYMKKQEHARLKREKQFAKHQERKKQLTETKHVKGFRGFYKRTTLRIAILFGGMRHRRLFLKSLTTGVLLVCVIGGSTWSALEHHHKVIERLKVQTIFDQDLSFSKSMSPVTLSSPERSSDRKTVVIPLQVQQMDRISTSANDYHVFVRSATGTLQFEPKIQLIVYGRSGSMALVVKSPVAIPNQVLHIYVRNDRKLLAPGEQNTDSADPQDTNVDTATEALRKKFDVLDFTVNLGVERMKVLPKTMDMKHEDITLQNIYRRYFADEKVKDVQKDIDTNEKLLETLYQRADDYRKLLENEGYIVPLAPKLATRKTLPSDAYPVNIHSNLDKGFVEDKDVKRMNEALNNHAVSFDENHANDTEDNEELLKKDGFDSLPDSLKKDDGTTTSDAVNNPDGNQETSPAAYWETLTSTWHSIRDTKRKIYVDDALKLYAVQADVVREKDSATTLPMKNFKIVGDVAKDK